jgi:hypothetical protein
VSPTHYGFNHTHIGHHMQPRGWKAVQTDRPLRPLLEELVDREPRLCRIWVRYEDSSVRCVYWWERDLLDSNLDKET